MKLIPVLLVLGLPSFGSANHSDLLPTAISQIIQNHCEKHSEEFDFIVFGKDTKNLSEIVDLTMKNLKIPAKVIRAEEKEILGPFDSYVTDEILEQMKREFKRIKLDKSAVLFFETYNSFKYFVNHSSLVTEYPKDLNFLVFIKERFDFEEMLSSENSFVLRASFIEEMSAGDMEFFLVTAKTRQSPNCQQWTQETINIFSRKNQTWRFPKFFREDIKDFQGCEVVFAFKVPNSLIFEVKPNGELDGYGKIFIEEIAKSLNISSKLLSIPHEKYFSEPFDVFVSTSSMRQLFTMKRFQNSIDFYATASDAFVTHPFTVIDSVLLIPQPSPYSQFEKVFLPFEKEVWVWLLVTLAGGLVAITIIKFTSKTVQKFVFGSRVLSPVLNFV
jgi:hypothetical protein